MKYFTKLAKLPKGIRRALQDASYIMDDAEKYTQHNLFQLARAKTHEARQLTEKTMKQLGNQSQLTSRQLQNQLNIINKYDKSLKRLDSKRYGNITRFSKN